MVHRLVETVGDVKGEKSMLDVAVMGDMLELLKS